MDELTEVEIEIVLSTLSAPALTAVTNQKSFLLTRRGQYAREVDTQTIFLAASRLRRRSPKSQYYSCSSCSNVFYPKSAIIVVQHYHYSALALELLSSSIAYHQHCLALALLSISIAQHQHCIALALLGISIAWHQHCLAFLRISIRSNNQLTPAAWTEQHVQSCFPK